MPSGSRFPPQPGAQAAIQFALFSESAMPAPSPRREPRTAEARPARAGVAASSFFASASLRRRDAEEDHVVNDLRLSRLDARGGHERVAGPLRVEEEAAVVVGHALRRRRPVRGLHAEVQERLAVAHLGALLRRGLAGRAVDLAAGARPREDRGALAGAQDASVLRRRTPGNCFPGGQGGMSPRLRPRRRSQPSSCEICLRGVERERRDAPGSMTAGALLRDDRRDVAREARRGSAVARWLSRHRQALPSGTASASTAAAAIAMRVDLRMLGVICTPKLAQDAADLADRAACAQAPRAAAGGGSRRTRATSRTSASADAAAARRSRSARTRAVRSRWRRSISGSTWRSSTRSAPSSVKRVHADDDALAGLDLALVAGTPTPRSPPGRSPARSPRPLRRGRRCARSARARAPSSSSVSASMK